MDNDYYSIEAILAENQVRISLVSGIDVLIYFTENPMHFQNRHS